MGPPETLWVYWPLSGLSPRMNETVDTGEIMTPPSLNWMEPWWAWGSLYTVMIVDFGVDRDGANVVHWMKHNVQQGFFGSEGVENFDYLPPFSYDCNEDCCSSDCCPCFQASFQHRCGRGGSRL